MKVLNYLEKLMLLMFSIKLDVIFNFNFASCGTVNCSSIIIKIVFDPSGAILTKNLKITCLE